MPGGDPRAWQRSPWNWKDNDWTFFLQVWQQPEQDRGDFQDWFTFWHPLVVHFGDEDLRALCVEKDTLEQIMMAIKKKRRSSGRS